STVRQDFHRNRIDSATARTVSHEHGAYLRGKKYAEDKANCEETVLRVEQCSPQHIQKRDERRGSKARRRQPAPARHAGFDLKGGLRRSDSPEQFEKERAIRGSLVFKMKRSARRNGNERKPLSFARPNLRDEAIERHVGGPITQ